MDTPGLEEARALREWAYEAFGHDHWITRQANLTVIAETYIGYVTSLPPRPAMSEDQNARVDALLAKHTWPPGLLQPPWD
ncbi:hypothetical protein GCM10017691_24200 [Pseudonocardia petroleophila]